MSIYIEKGYQSREDYLRKLGDEHGVDFEIVEMFADVLGESEDFDGLVTEIEDFANDRF